MQVSAKDASRLYGAEKFPNDFYWCWFVICVVFGTDYKSAPAKYVPVSFFIITANKAWG